MIRYINTEPHDIHAELQLDNSTPPIIGTGSQHIEFDIPSNELHHGAWITCNADGYEEQRIRVLIIANDAQLIDESTGRGLDVVLIPTANPAVILPRLITAGQCLRLEDGTHWTAIECSDFNLFGRYLNGEDITGIIEDRNGFNLHRVWTRYDLSQYGIGRCTLSDHPNLYDEVQSFCNILARNGRYVEFSAYTGREDYDPNHWQRLGEACAGLTNVILELVNENDQSGNHIDPNAFSKIDGIICSHGSNGSQVPPVKPYWDYATFHTNGASEWWRKNGHNAMEVWDGPTLTNESTRAPDNDNNPNHYYDAAAGSSLLCVGSCFHSVSGKSSVLFTDEEKMLAWVHVVGANSVDLRYQDGRYIHRSDLEPSGILRTYGKVLNDGEFDVRIRE